jgi:hypothetical protein
LMQYSNSGTNSNSSGSPANRSLPEVDTMTAADRIFKPKHCGSSNSSNSREKIPTTNEQVVFDPAKHNQQSS